MANERGPAMAISGSSDGSPRKFPGVLFKILRTQDPEIIGWSRSGRVVLIKDPERFNRDIMPKFFNTGKYSSFVRQLRLYSFRKLTGGDDAGGYMHPFFERGKEHQLGQVDTRHVPEIPPEFAQYVTGHRRSRSTSSPAPRGRKRRISTQDIASAGNFGGEHSASVGPTPERLLSPPDVPLSMSEASGGNFGGEHSASVGPTPERLLCPPDVPLSMSEASAGNSGGEHSASVGPTPERLLSPPDVPLSMSEALAGNFGGKHSASVRPMIWSGMLAPNDGQEDPNLAPRSNFLRHSFQESRFHGQQADGSFVGKKRNRNQDGISPRMPKLPRASERPFPTTGLLSKRPAAGGYPIGTHWKVLSHLLLGEEDEQGVPLLDGKRSPHGCSGSALGTSQYLSWNSTPATSFEGSHSQATSSSTPSPSTSSSITSSSFAAAPTGRRGAKNVTPSIRTASSSTATLPSSTSVSSSSSSSVSSRRNGSRGMYHGLTTIAKSKVGVSASMVTTSTSALLEAPVASSSAATTAGSSLMATPVSFAPSAPGWGSVSNVPCSYGSSSAAVDTTKVDGLYGDEMMLVGHGCSTVTLPQNSISTATGGSGVGTRGGDDPETLPSFGLIGDELGEFGIDGPESGSPGSDFSPGNTAVDITGLLFTEILDDPQAIEDGRLARLPRTPCVRQPQR